MNRKDEEHISKTVSALRSVAEKIRRCEAEAQEALFFRNDLEQHRQKLEEKARLLSELPETVRPFLDGLGRNIRAEIEAGVKDFARRAMQALELSSIFYLSTLLYPADYKEGERNDLETFIDHVGNKYLS